MSTSPGGCGEVVARLVGAVKRFRRGPVIGPVSLEARRGEVLALLGPNGSGKTTTIRMLLGIYEPDSGYVEACGVKGRSARGLASYVPEESAVYPRLTGWEHLRLLTRLYGADASVVSRAAEISGLGEDLSRRVGEYSRGMKRRLLLGFALALPTPLVVLDEPTSGLDVYSSVAVRRLIRRAAEDEGRAVLFSSHNMFEVEKVADRVLFIGRGRVLAEGRPSELLERFNAADLEEAFVKAFEEVQRAG